jgi:hypothetical protein
MPQSTTVALYPIAFQNQESKPQIYRCDSDNGKSIATKNTKNTNSEAGVPIERKWADE